MIKLFLVPLYKKYDKCRLTLALNSKHTHTQIIKAKIYNTYWKNPGKKKYRNKCTNYVWCCSCVRSHYIVYYIHKYCCFNINLFIFSNVGTLKCVIWKKKQIIDIVAQVFLFNISIYSVSRMFRTSVYFVCHCRYARGSYVKFYIFCCAIS